MKNKALFASLFILFFSCTDDEKTSPAKPSNSNECAILTPSPGTLNGKWKVFMFRINDSAITKTQENSLGMDVTVIFDDTQTPHYTGGKNTPNDFAGTFEYAGSESIVVSSWISTLIGQPEWGNYFSMTFYKKLRFEFSNNNNELILTNDRNDAILLCRLN